MADTTIDIEGMNDQMARTDSLVARLAQDVDRLTESFSNFSKSANVEKMLGTINQAFETMSDMSTTAANNVTTRVSTIIGEITNLSETVGKLGISRGIKLDFFQGDNLTKRQKDFNAAILKMAENYEKAQANVDKYKNKLVELYAKTPESKRNDDSKNQKFLEARFELLGKIAKEQEVMNANEQAYLLVQRKTAETQNLINQAKQQEKKDIQELTNLYNKLREVSQKREAALSTAFTKHGGATAAENEIIRSYSIQIDELQRKISSLAQKYPELAEKMRASFNLSMLEQSVKLREREEKQILKKVDAVERVSREIDKQIEKENKLAGERAKRLLYEKRTSVSGALDYSAKVKNEIQAKQAIEYLTAARQKLDKTDVNYEKDLKRLNAEIQRHQQFLRNAGGETTRLQTRTFSLLQSTKQLAEGFGIMFSVYGISNFIRKLVQVTGEFEIQQTALKSIIQSGDKAQTMFMELQKMAVASPYSIQQLVSYNKQLAAYRVETDKLLPTLKQLGDVASGVGVDMQRLILAYGQVKAANYLRGQELRQFSEAGINILKLLADRFSDAEGKVVTTGDVFDRVSKRLVKFEDVAAVFDDLTKKGGVFYDMQAKQAKTVRGQLMNLKDAFQIALYEIGQETNGSIKSFLSLLRGVAKNLTTIVKLGSTALVLFIAWRTNLAIAEMRAMGIKKYISDAATGSAIKKLADLFGNIKGHPIAAAATIASTAVLAFAVQIIKAKKRVEELRKESIDTFSEINENLTKFTDLIKESGDYKVFGENGKTRFKLVRTDNLKNDLRVVQNFLEDLEKQGIELKPGFDLEYSENDKDKLAAQLADFMNDVQDRASSLISAFEGGKTKVAKFADPIERYTKSLSRDIEKLKENIRLGGLGISNEIIAAGKKIKLPDDEINAAVEALNRLQTGQYSSLTEAYQLWQKVADIQEIIKASTKKRLEYEKISNKIASGFKGLFDGISNSASTLNTEFEKLLKQFSDFKGVSVEEMLGLMADPKKGKQLVNEFMQYTKGAFLESGKPHTDDLWNQQLIWLRDAQKVKPFIIEPLIKKPKQDEKKELAKWQIAYNRWAEAANARLKKINKDLKVDTIEETEAATTQEEQMKALSGRYDELADKIKMYANEAEELKTLHKDEYKAALAEQKEVDNLRRKLGYTDKKSAKSAKDRSSEFEKMVKFIRQLRSEYDKLNKTFSSGESFKKVTESFKDEFEAMPKFFQDVFGGDISNILFTSPEQVVESLKKIEPILKQYYSTWQKKLEIYFQKNKAEEMVEVQVEIKKKSADEINRQIEDLFSNYEIQLQLTELGLTTDEAKDIFNLDAIDLAELGKKLGEYRDEILENFGKDELAKYEEYQKKYTEIYEKAQMERMKKYSAYLQKEMSERVKVEMETLKQLAELDSIPALYSNDEDSAKYKARERIRNKILEDRDKKIDAIIWKEFQQTDFYVSLFTDLGNASYQSLGMMKERLEELRGSLKNLSASDLKAVSENLQRIDDQLLQDNPFDALITAAKDFKKMRKDIEKDRTLEKILGVDKVKNFRKGMTDALNEINKKLYGYVEIQEDGSKKINEGLVGQLHLQEKLYQAAKMRDTAASELKKQDIGFGDEWFVPQAALDAQKKNVQMYADMIAKETDANKIEELKKEQAAIQLVVDTLEKYIKATKDLGDKSGQTSEKLGKNYDKTKKEVKGLTKTYNDLSDTQEKAKKRIIAAAESLRFVSEAVSKIQSLYETWIENIDYLGGETTDLTEAQAKLGKAIFDNLRNILDLTARILDAIPDITAGFTSAGVAINSAMGIIGLIAEAIQLVITLVSAIGKFKDDMIAVEIKSIQRKVDTLAKSYEALSEAFSSAFDQDRLREYNKLMVNSLEQQKAFLEQEKALEEDKKKRDRDAINDLSDRIDDINKQLAETSQKLYEELGGFGSDSAYKDAATQFVEAWYNAFTETGSGLSGLEDKFDEFFVSMLKKQLMQKVADKYFKDLLEEFDELLNRGDIWENDYMWTEYMNRVPERLQAANDVLAGLYSSLQGLFGAGGIGGLSNLQQGIQGVTESTADILAGYMSSMLTYVAQNTTNITSLSNWLGVGSTNDSLMSNIRITAKNTTAINTLLQSLVPNIAHNLGGSGIKVFVS